MSNMNGNSHADDVQFPDHLSIATQAAFDALNKQDDPDCLEGTRTDILHEIRQRVADSESSCILWLNGMAGTGKSTIARTICRELHESGTLGASFFFSADGGETLSRMHLFYSTIASQLSRAGPVTLRHHICTAARDHADVLEKGRGFQWRSLILNPLKMVKRSANRLTRVIVIDALDECDDEKDVHGLVGLLQEASKLVNVRMRIIIVSRPVPPVSDSIAEIPAFLIRQLALDEQQQQTIDGDIRLYFLNEFEKIKRQKILNYESWPGVRAISRLVRLSAGLFIYAATACTFIAEDIDRTAEGSLAWFLEEMELTEKQAGLPRGGKDGRDHTERLDRMYVRILQNALRDGTTEAKRDRLAQYLRNLLGAVVALQEPITPSTLQNLRQVQNENVRSRLRRLHSVIRVPADDLSTVRLSHVAFRDFLLDRDRCRDARFVIDPKKNNNDLLDNCLESMYARLRRDICNLCHPGALKSRTAKAILKDCLPSCAQAAHANTGLYTINSLQALMTQFIYF